MNISASIYANPKLTLKEVVTELDRVGIDLFHVDCKDDERVFGDIADIRKISKTPIDLHLITATPERYFQQIAELKIEYVTFQYENLLSVPSLPKSDYTSFGLSLVSSTDVTVFQDFKEQFSYVMLMTTAPGESGGVFNRNTFQRVLSFKHKFPNHRIHVDGGVNDQIAFVLRLIGVNTVVTGSYLMGHESLGLGLLRMHRTQDVELENSFVVADFATPLAQIPLLQEESLSVVQILQNMEQYRMGFVAIIDEQKTLKGIVSNADLRRGLLKHTDDFNTLSIQDLINPHPITIAENTPLHGMIQLLNKLNFIVLFLPIVDNENRIKGAVLLHHLTRV
jgi:pentose-5-phosphate-3-epimerase